VVHELVIAFLLGLIGGVIPGPVITAVFTEILQSGLPRSFRIIFSALTAETFVAVLCLLLLESLDFNEGFFRGLSLVGAMILIWISVSLWKIRSVESGEKVRFTLWKIFLMILSNGVLWTYWITICIPKAILLSEQRSMGAYLFMGLVQLGWLFSTIMMAIVFSRFRSLLSGPGVLPVVFKVFSGAFAYFALDMIYKSYVFFFK